MQTHKHRECMALQAK